VELLNKVWDLRYLQDGITEMQDLIFGAH
jgi:hypothetical protein